MTETIYSYGMRLRGFSIGCQPMKGLLFTADDESGRYHDLLVYDRKLTDKELSDYELDYIGEGKMNPSKVPHHKIKNGFGGDKSKLTTIQKPNILKTNQ